MRAKLRAVWLVSRSRRQLTKEGKARRLTYCCGRARGLITLLSQTIGAKIIVRRLDERLAFVPEGQHDSSQARSAWNHEENSPSQRDG